MLEDTNSLDSAQLRIEKDHEMYIPYRMYKENFRKTGFLIIKVVFLPSLSQKKN